jgi:hypothetical protein
MSHRTHSLVLAALLAGSSIASTGCGDAKLATSALDSVSSDPTSCREEHPEGVVAFVVAPDGGVRAGVTGADGKPAKIDGGTLSFRKDGGAPTEAKLAPEGDGMVAAAKGPAVDANVTSIDYVVQTGGKTLKGVLHIPSGGTKTLSESAKTLAAEEKPGPNGGQVQVVAGEPVEVAIAPSGDVAADVLYRHRKVVVTPGRTLWIVVDDEKVALSQRDDGVFVGRTRVTAPRKVTVVLVRDGKPHVALVGFRAGIKLSASRAPGLVMVQAIAPSKGPVDKNPDEPGMGHALGKEKRDGDDDHGKDKKSKPVDGPDHDQGRGNDKPGRGKDEGGGSDKGGGNDKGGGKGKK